MADLLVVRLQALDNTRDAKVVVVFGAVQRPDRETDKAATVENSTGFSQSCPFKLSLLRYSPNIYIVHIH